MFHVQEFRHTRIDSNISEEDKLLYRDNKTYRIVSYRIVSYRIVSYRVIWYRILQS